MYDELPTENNLFKAAIAAAGVAAVGIIGYMILKKKQEEDAAAFKDALDKSDKSGVDITYDDRSSKNGGYTTDDGDTTEDGGFTTTPIMPTAEAAKTAAIFLQPVYEAGKTTGQIVYGAGAWTGEQVSRVLYGCANATEQLTHNNAINNTYNSLLNNYGVCDAQATKWFQEHIDCRQPTNATTTQIMAMKAACSGTTFGTASSVLLGTAGAVQQIIQNSPQVNIASATADAATGFLGWLAGYLPK